MAPAPARRLLVIEDDPETAEVERSILALEGFEIDVARDGAEAVARLAATRYDGIVLDAHLPGIDGYQVAARIRELPRNRHTPIVMVTASGEPDARQRGFDLGVVAFLAKPFKPATLRSLIATLAR
jgi:two-component system CheB/CheR fusion protein